MNNKNSKSESYVVREAKNIVDNYIKNRELKDIKKYYQLKEKYDRLRILAIAVMITSCIGTLLSVIV